MRPCAPSGISLAVLLLLAAVGPAWGESYALTAGQPAPADGVLVDVLAGERLVEELRDGRAAAAKVETLTAANAKLQAQLDSLTREVAALREEATARERALAVSEERARAWQEQEARLTAVLARSDRALEKYEALTERLDKRVRELERESFWRGLLGPLGLILGVVLGAAL